MSNPKRISNGIKGEENESDTPGSTPTWYTIVMTPVNFVTFLFSLVLVDLRYSLLRAHTHAAERPSRLPTWLHPLLYTRGPYETYPGPERDRQGRWYYHSKQKKLMRMEAEEAFRFRGRVLVFLGLSVALATTGLWYLFRKAFSHWTTMAV